MQKTIVLGSGGHAKVVIEILREVGLYEPVGCVALCPPENHELLGVPYLGSDDDLTAIWQQGTRCAFVAIGDNHLRQVLLDRVRQIGFQIATAVSRSACVSPSARLGRGIAIMPGSIVGADSTVGEGSILNTKASVDHDGALGKCCHIGPGATLAGNVQVGDLAFIATGSTVIPDVGIGPNSIVGAGSVVVRDVPADVVAYGVPAETRRTIGGSTTTTSEVAPTGGTTTLRLVS